jgi:hypothetical protein
MMTRAAWGQDAPTLSDADVENLRTGHYVWTPELAPDGPMTMVISLSEQRVYVFRNRVLIGASTISSGRRGHETPTGVFTILEKAKKHRSNKYSNASMPYMQRLTWDGVAMHAGHLPGYPASHGCVRLPLQFSKLLYQETTLGMTVVITESASPESVLDTATPPAPVLPLPPPPAPDLRLAPETPAPEPVTIPTGWGQGSPQQ